MENLGTSEPLHKHNSQYKDLESETTVTTRYGTGQARKTTAADNSSVLKAVKKKNPKQSVTSPTTSTGQE